MEGRTMNENSSIRLAWAVLANGPLGHSEVIKITDHEDADKTVRDNPKVFWKSGPFVLPY